MKKLKTRRIHKQNKKLIVFTAHIRLYSNVAIINKISYFQNMYVVFCGN